MFRFDKVATKQILDLCEAIMDSSFMEMEFIRAKYIRQSPNFSETLEFLRELNLIALKHNEIVPIGDYEALLAHLRQSQRREEVVRTFMRTHLL
ncbi:MAG: hypothetical protein NTZ04_06105 [Chloroflexi bacterium]|nr:hypothetical protein [Chloroflexota bacterium]